MKKLDFLFRLSPGKKRIDFLWACATYAKTENRIYFTYWNAL